MTTPAQASAPVCDTRRQPWVLVVLLLCSACSTVPPSNVKSNARLTPASRITRDLTQLPEPKARIAVAVYGFRDQTGQFKPSPDSSYSTSVTQGAASMLVKALKDSGWYLPVEREGLQNLLTERKIVRAIESPTEKGKPLVNLPNLMPASLIIEGGVIAFESNVRTGGKGANYLGVGANTQYRIDQVTVSLRGIDIRTGQVLNAVSVTKTIYSYQFSASLYKYTSYQHLLQAETGYTTNEPAQLAVREAIEAAVVHMTAQGVRDRLLELKDERNINSPIIQTYLTESARNLNEDGDANPVPIGYAAQNGDLVSPIQPLMPLETARSAPARTPAQLAPVSVAAPAPPPVLAPAAVPRSEPAHATAAPRRNAAPAPASAGSRVPVASAPVPVPAPASTAAPAPAGSPTPLPAAAHVTPREPLGAPTAKPLIGLPTDDIFKQYWRQ